MTPNGAAAFALVAVLAAILGDAVGLAAAGLIVAAFAAIETGARSWAALRRAVLVMLPLAAFMLVIWAGIVGRSPSEIAAGVPGSRTAALAYVAGVAARLFVVVLLVQVVTLRFAEGTPFGLIRRLYLPLGAKRVVVVTLSLIETLRQSIDRAHTALIAGGIVTRTLSLRNAANGWLLIQTVWLTAITTVTARLRDKWPVESTLALLDPALDGAERRLAVRDMVWIGLALAALVIAAAR